MTNRINVMHQIIRILLTKIRSACFLISDKERVDKIDLTILSYHLTLPSYLIILSYHPISFLSDIHSTKGKITSIKGIKDTFQNHIENVETRNKMSKETFFPLSEQFSKGVLSSQKFYLMIESRIKMTRNLVESKICI